jgi:ATP-dependent RNA helicase RhlE
LDLANLRNTEKLIGKKIPVVKDHPFHTDDLVEQKRDSNNKPFTPKPKPQQKSEIGFKSLKIKDFLEKIKKKTGNNFRFLYFK